MFFFFHFNMFFFCWKRYFLWSSIDSELSICIFRWDKFKQFKNCFWWYKKNIFVVVENCVFCYNFTNMYIFFLLIIQPRIMNWSKVWRMAKCCPRTYIMFGLMVRSFFLTELRSSSSEGRNGVDVETKTRCYHFWWKKRVRQN